MLAKPEVVTRTPQNDWMDECVPLLMSYGKDQIVAVAACMRMWREDWEEDHPDGADDPGPSPKEADPESPLADTKAYNEADHPRDEHGRWTDGGGGDDSHPGEGYSKDAKLINGVIHTSNVYDAVRALHEDRPVELDQPRTVSVLIDKLGEISKDMIAKGEKAPNFNLCNVTIKATSLFCADSAGIPRVQMPQVTKGDDEKFRQYMIDKGYKVTDEEQYASHLRATQNQLNGAKVAGIARAMRRPGGYSSNPIFVSNDDYILDGHHRWAAEIGVDAANNILADSKKMAIWRVNATITQLLAEAELFTGGKGKLGMDEDRKKRAAKLLALLRCSPVTAVFILDGIRWEVR